MKTKLVKVTALLAIIVAGSASGLTAKAELNPTPELTHPAADSTAWHAREGAWFKRNWGVDIVDVRRVSSGEMLAFRYIVLDPAKAKALNDKQSTAFLIDENSGQKLQVPQMEKIGALRTSVTPKSGRMYWVVFANTGHLVNAGSKVDVTIGDFHVEGLTVDAR